MAPLLGGVSTAKEIGVGDMTAARTSRVGEEEEDEVAE